MTNKTFLYLFILIAVFLIANHSFAEELNLTTYYPAPFGSYDRLRLVPRAEMIDPDCDAGTLYVNEDNENNLYICDDSSGVGEWEVIGENVWKKEDPNVYLIDGDTNVVGIGDAEPDAKLEISDSGAGTSKLLMISSDTENDGDFLIVDEKGNIGIGTTTNIDEDKVLIKGIAGKNSLVVTDSSNNKAITVKSDAKVIIGDIASPAAGGTLEINKSGSDVTIILNESSGGQKYYIAIDQSDSSSFVIGTGDTVGSNNVFKIDASGATAEITITGNLTVNGFLQAQFVEGSPTDDLNVSHDLGKGYYQANY